MNNRREFILTAAGATVAALAARSGFQNILEPSAAAADTKSAPAQSSTQFADLAKTASDCIKTGTACLAHCQRELGAGNTGMANCSVRVHEMLALTQAMLTLASLGSSQTLKLAAVCADACRTCADACAEHKGHFSHGMHLECKTCMEACLACEKACRKAIAA